ncbi:MAG: DNA repair protein RecN [Cytophagaceae bacterium]|jgi:DNA repair protein RecN (Recombination protein N)|nr:DNA repair protein RecN [Cytophagaceae bacterium]
MLRHLLIKNYALIRELEFSPAKDFTVITGETGAGKSIMLGALGLLLGNRADSKALFEQDEKCIIEGTFVLNAQQYAEFFEEADLDPEEECIIRREITSAGKSRMFVNDTPVTLDIVKKWAPRLVDIHSQHDTLLLANQGIQMDVLDSFSNALALRQSFQQQFKSFRKTESEYQHLVAKATEEKKQLDYYSFLFKELDEADVKIGEQESLEEKLKLLENAEQIISKLSQTAQWISGDQNSIVDQLKLAEKNLESLSKFSSAYHVLHERLRSALLELKDLGAELESLESEVEYNPALMQEMEARLSRLYSLQTKHQVNSSEKLIAIRDQLQSNIQRTENLDQEIGNLEKLMETQRKSMMKTANELSALRKKHTAPLQEKIEGLLKEVGIVNGSVRIELVEKDPYALGIDEVSIRFSANKGVAPQELKNAASGGEFSRLMLCIKFIMADRIQLPTIVFDEIDTGISGEIAIKVGKLIKKLSEKHQVITITHLPQMASQGSVHCYVYKDHEGSRTNSRMKKLSEKERVEEIAKMIGGEKPSATAIQNAKELLSL